MKVLKGTRAHSQIPSSLGLSRTSPSSEFLWLFSHCVPSTVRRRCDMRVPSASIRPFACGFRFAQRTGHCDGLCGKGPMMEWEIIPLQREGNLELCTLFSCFFFSNPQSFPRYYLPISHGHGDDGPIFFTAHCDCPFREPSTNRTRSFEVVAPKEELSVRAKP
jgi:hypothetical protein